MITPRLIDMNEDNKGVVIYIFRILLRAFGIVSTVTLCAAAIVPKMFFVPFNLRPWVFVISIFWFFAFCAGMFNL